MQRKAAGSWLTIGTVVYEDEDWVLRYSSSGRIERYETLAEAKDLPIAVPRDSPACAGIDRMPRLDTSLIT